MHSVFIVRYNSVHESIGWQASFSLWNFLKFSPDTVLEPCHTKIFSLQASLLCCFWGRCRATCPFFCVLKLLSRPFFSVLQPYTEKFWNNIDKRYILSTFYKEIAIPLSIANVVDVGFGAEMLVWLCIFELACTRLFVEITAFEQFSCLLPFRNPIFYLFKGALSRSLSKSWLCQFSKESSAFQKYIAGILKRIYQAEIYYEHRRYLSKAYSFVFHTY